ncbi:MAG TPA: hypothetical protein VHE53_01430 [Patescibacteria group bacterium]|nr:hypothetical protein [Patescibacteria group bacterium]
MQESLTPEVNTSIPGFVKALDYSADFEVVRGRYLSSAEVPTSDTLVDLDNFPVNSLDFHNAFPYLDSLIRQVGLANVRSLVFSQVSGGHAPRNKSSLTFLKFGEQGEINVHTDGFRASVVAVIGAETDTRSGEEYLKQGANRDRVIVDVANFVATLKSAQS